MDETKRHDAEPTPTGDAQDDAIPPTERPRLRIEVPGLKAGMSKQCYCNCRSYPGCGISCCSPPNWPH